MRLVRAPAKPKRRVAHLGNIGTFMPEQEMATKTKKYAERFKDFEFVGIDKAKYNVPEGIEKWKQKQSDFVIGLLTEKNNSFDVISSEMAVGYYGPIKLERPVVYPHTRATKIYTNFLMKLIYKKLKKGGKLNIVAGESALDNIIEGLHRTPLKEKYKIKELSESEKQKLTYWTKTKKFYWGGKMLDNTDDKIYRITAEK